MVGAAGCCAWDAMHRAHVAPSRVSPQVGQTAIHATHSGAGRRHPSASGLLLGQRTNNGQYQLLVLIGLDEQDQPQYKKPDSDEPEYRKQKQCPTTRKNGYESEYKSKGDGEDAIENRLKRMKTDFRILIVGCQHQKQNPGDETNGVAQSRGHVISQTHRRGGRVRRSTRARHTRRRCRWSRSTRYRSPALRAKTPVYLAAAICTEWHIVQLYFRQGWFASGYCPEFVRYGDRHPSINFSTPRRGDARKPRKGVRWL